MKKNSIALLLLTPFFIFSPTLIFAQSLDFPVDMDLIAPTIRHKLINRSIGHETPLMLEARVTDNNALDEVILFYRTTGEEAFKKIHMKLDGNKTYSIGITGKEVLSPGFEYYIQASDKAGNLTLRGFSFSPLTIVVSPLVSKKEVSPRSRKKNRLPPPSF